LALLDEVTIELPWKIVKESEAALAPAQFIKTGRVQCDAPDARKNFQRPGKTLTGQGFYEYPEGGKEAPCGRALSAGPSPRHRYTA